MRGVDYIRADRAGVVLFLKAPGDVVQKGEAVAEIITPLGRNDTESRHYVTSQTEGLLFARIHDRFARPGRVLAKVAGKMPLREKGENLLTS